jgi:tetratricopeptide (TPR) repeat protein
MRAALAHAATPAGVAFARYYLGELARTSGRPGQALKHFRAGLAADPGYAALHEGRAKALAALGRTGAAVREFRHVVTTVPQPSYLLEFARLLTALGRQRAAAGQLAVFRTEERLFRANGVALDTDQTLFEADFGNSRAAVRSGRAALRTRPFLESHDALGWALHRAGRDRAALREANDALATGIRNATFHFHRGVIAHALGREALAARDLATALRLDPAFDPLDAPVARHILTSLRVRS